MKEADGKLGRSAEKTKRIPFVFLADVCFSRTF
jgi:hypothetical protein